MEWMDWLRDNPWAAWLGVALALAAIEAATADFIFLMLAGGAVAGMIVGFVTGQLAVQIIAACVVALVLLGTVRPVLKRRLLDHLPGSGLGIETYAGRTATVTEPVDERDGRVSFDGEIWSARTERPTIPLQKGASVTIVRVDGATLVVAPATEVQDVVRDAGDPQG